MSVQDVKNVPKYTCRGAGYVFENIFERDAQTAPAREMAQQEAAAAENPTPKLTSTVTDTRLFFEAGPIPVPMETFGAAVPSRPAREEMQK